MARYLLLLAATVTTVVLGWLSFAVPATTTPPHQPTAPTALGEEVRTRTDGTDVFRRAFWRDPSADDRILHAERREWVSHKSGVRRWQWFLALEPSAELAKYLTEQNPFNLAKTALPKPYAEAEIAPSWFPSRVDSSASEVRQSPSGNMTLFYDANRSTLYATDAGHGFSSTVAGERTVSQVPAK